MLIETYRAEHLPGVDALRRAVFPDDPPRNAAAVAIPAKLAVDDLLFVALEAGAVVGTILAGYDGHRGWLYAVAVAPERQRTGLGSALVRHA